MLCILFLYLISIKLSIVVTRFREDDDDISPYIKGLTFHDYDNQPDLMFDKSQYKAKKSVSYCYTAMI